MPVGKVESDGGTLKGLQGPTSGENQYSFLKERRFQKSLTQANSPAKVRVTTLQQNQQRTHACSPSPNKDSDQSPESDTAGQGQNREMKASQFKISRKPVLKQLGPLKNAQTKQNKEQESEFGIRKVNSQHNQPEKSSFNFDDGRFRIRQAMDSVEAKHQRAISLGLENTKIGKELFGRSPSPVVGMKKNYQHQQQ